MKTTLTKEQQKEILNYTESIRVYEWQGRVMRAENTKKKLQEYLTINNITLN